MLAPANDPVRREAGRQVVLAIQRAGGRAALVPLSRERLGQAVGEGGRVASFELAIWGIPPLASHDPDFLAAIFGSRGAGGVLNRSGYASAAFDELAATVAAAPSPPARRQAISALLARLATDVPAVPLLFAAGNFAYRSTSPVGWTFAAGTGILDKQSLLKPAPARVAARAASPTPAAQRRRRRRRHQLVRHRRGWDAGARVAAGRVDRARAEELSATMGTGADLAAIQAARERRRSPT